MFFSQYILHASKSPLGAPDTWPLFQNCQKQLKYGLLVLLKVRHIFSVSKWQTFFCSTVRSYFNTHVLPQTPLKTWTYSPPLFIISLSFLLQETLWVIGQAQLLLVGAGTGDKLSLSGPPPCRSGSSALLKASASLYAHVYDGSFRSWKTLLVCWSWALWLVSVLTCFHTIPSWPRFSAMTMQYLELCS